MIAVPEEPKAGDKIKKYLRKGMECEPNRWVKAYNEYLASGGEKTVQYEKFKLCHEFDLETKMFDGT